MGSNFSIRCCECARQAPLENSWLRRAWVGVLTVAFALKILAADAVSTGGIGVASSVPSSRAVALWSLNPLLSPPVPTGLGSEHPIDRFIDAALVTQGLHRAPEAQQRTLIRRVAWDLTGLPPTPGEVDTFLSDPSPEAFERMVDRYLVSPAYGERWGRWWLDLARYADTNGQDENKVMANAWRYRDWVIRSFNANQSYDQFVQEQLAGDLLDRKGVPESQVFDRYMATGFLVLGPKMLAEQDKPKLVMDLVDEQIDVVSRAFLGLTMSCARCHDHKFDPISAQDYYAMAGIFRSTKTLENLAFVSKFNERPITGSQRMAAIEAHKSSMSQIQKQYDEAARTANAGLQREWQAVMSRDLPLWMDASRSAATNSL